MHLCVSDEQRVCRCSVPAVSLIKRHRVQRGLFWHPTESLYIPSSLPLYPESLITMEH